MLEYNGYGNFFILKRLYNNMFNIQKNMKHSLNKHQLGNRGKEII